MSQQCSIVRGIAFRLYIGLHFVVMNARIKLTLSITSILPSVLLTSRKYFALLGWESYYSVFFEIKTRYCGVWYQGMDIRAIKISASLTLFPMIRPGFLAFVFMSTLASSSEQNIDHQLQVP